MIKCQIFRKKTLNEFIHFVIDHAGWLQVLYDASSHWLRRYGSLEAASFRVKNDNHCQNSTEFYAARTSGIPCVVV